MRQIAGGKKVEGRKSRAEMYPRGVKAARRANDPGLRRRRLVRNS